MSDERREAPRRRLPFVRSGVLEIRGRNHIVSVADLSPQGALLGGRVSAEIGEAAVLHMVLPGAGRKEALPCRVARLVDSPQGAGGPASGLGVRFEGLETPLTADSVGYPPGAGPTRPEPAPTAGETWEYRVLDVEDLDERDLNRIGQDGWRLATAVSVPTGVRLVLLRRP
ncbi:MAG TPA: PilZ domain-containing protein [Vicinamibacteria bacterium]